MKELQLTQGKVALVDDEDFEWLNQYKWRYGSDKRRYAIRNSARPNRKTLCLAKVIMNTPDDMETDHINGDKLDNRKCNLRICTGTQNQGNRKLNKNNTSGYKGVFLCNNQKTWMAQIIIKHKPKYLGRFIDVKDAAKAYDTAAIDYFGEFAKTNKSMGLLDK